MIEFREFPKIPRLNRNVLITEKIDGTNGCVVIDEDGNIAAQSRGRIITPEDDNFGFAAWVRDNREELLKLGPGHHFGEWWGRGIQRNYGLKERKFSLFNVTRWAQDRPSCCDVVPLIDRCVGFSKVDEAVQFLRTHGSMAALGFMKPEGIVVFHEASGKLFKVTCEDDESPKCRPQ